MFEWVDINEKIPADGQHVLVWRKTNSCIYSCMLYGGSHDFIILGTATDYVRREEVSHWMQHPEAPNVQGQGDGQA